MKQQGQWPVSFFRTLKGQRRAPGKIVGSRIFFLLFGLGIILFTSLQGFFSSTGETDLFHPRVVDGDTLADGRKRFRIAGIDACERGQALFIEGKEIDCGRLAAQTLQDFITEDWVRCKLFGRDKYKRLLARCFVRREGGKEEDLGRFMLASGFAVPAGGFFYFTLPYMMIHLKARIHKKGGLSGFFENPAFWRHSS